MYAVSIMDAYKEEPEVFALKLSYLLFGICPFSFMVRFQCCFLENHGVSRETEQRDPKAMTHVSGCVVGQRSDGTLPSPFK